MAAAQAIGAPSYRAADTEISGFSDLLLTLLDGATQYSLKKGYEPRRPLIDAMTSFHAWKKAYYTSPQATVERIIAIEAHSKAYEVILYKAFEQKGIVRPRRLLQCLEPRLLKSLCVIQDLPAGFDWQALSDDGAMRLILPRSATWKTMPTPSLGRHAETASENHAFPPRNAPEEIHRIWRDVTHHMGLADRLLLQNAFARVMHTSRHHFNDYYEYGLQAMAYQIRLKETDDADHGVVHDRVLRCIVRLHEALPRPRH
jgi:hypothetical protein